MLINKTDEKKTGFILQFYIFLKGKVLCMAEFRIQEDIEDNSKIIFLSSQ